uniref:CARD domain-containing protein n=1 Tax=Astyanax mexicanus TaxID=7994 RepID=A0A8B9LDH5_ASTMX
MFVELADSQELSPHRVSEAVLKDVIDGLRAANPPVLTGREANQIMQGNQVQEDRVGQLVDVVCKKGDVATRWWFRLTAYYLSLSSDNPCYCHLGLQLEDVNEKSGLL